MEAFFNRLRDNAFKTLDIEGYKPDISGWMDKHLKGQIQLIVNSKNKNEPLLIIEVGSWKGLSCICIADLLKELGFTNFKIFAIDTWLGAPEFWTWGINDPTRGGSLKLNQGFPEVFKTFTRNIKYKGHHDVVAPFPISSAQALEVLKYYRITADVIYIDAAHEYEPVKQDIKGYWEVLKNGGSMFGDDYMKNWPGVMKAVNEFAQENNKQPVLSGVVWNFTK